MGPLVALLAMPGIAVLWIFLSFQPRYVEERLLKAFNYMILGVVAMLSLVWFFYVKTNYDTPLNEKYVLPLTLIGALAIEIVFVIVGFVARNFWIFNPNRRKRY